MTKVSMTTRVISLVLLAAAVSRVPAASADSSAEAPAIRVHFGDLNLASPQGVAALYNRIVYAAEIVCGPKLATGSMIPLPSYIACSKKAIADAVAKIDRVNLTRYYLMREGQQPVHDAAVAGHGAAGG